MTTEKIEAGEVEAVEGVTCKGTNCGALAGGHSPECLLEAYITFGCGREDLHAAAREVFSQHSRIVAAKDAEIARFADEADRYRNERDAWIGRATELQGGADELSAQLAVPVGYALVPVDVLKDAMSMLEAHSPGSGSVESYAAQDIAKALTESAAPQQGELYECIGKGGQYEHLGHAKSAGIIKNANIDGLEIYRDTVSGRLYFRTPDDFGSRMARLNPSAQVSTYTTRAGESLMGIALRQLEDESRWPEIRDLNADEFPDMGPHDYYPVGTVLNMPNPSAQGEKP